MTITTDRALWVKVKKEIIHIDKVLSRERLAGITIYRMDNANEQLSSLITIESAHYNKQQWALHNVVTRTIGKRQVTYDTVEQAYTAILISPDILDVTAVEPEQLSAKQLSKLIEHQQKKVKHLR